MPKRFSNRPARRTLFPSPAPVHSSPPSIKGPSMKDSMKQGFGLGLGLEGARAAAGAIGSVFSSSDNTHQQSTAPIHTQSQPISQTTNGNTDFCGLERKLYEKCLDNTGNENNECTDLYTLYEKCTNHL